MENKPQYKASIILGIVSIVVGFFIPIVGVVCGIIGIVLNVKNKEMYNLTAGVTLCAVGIVISVISWIIGAVMVMKVMGAI